MRPGSRVSSGAISVALLSSLTLGCGPQSPTGNNAPIAGRTGEGQGLQVSQAEEMDEADRTVQQRRRGRRFRDRGSSEVYRDVGMGGSMGGGDGGTMREPPRDRGRRTTGRRGRDRWRFVGRRGWVGTGYYDPPPIMSAAPYPIGVMRSCQSSRDFCVSYWQDRDRTWAEAYSLCEGAYQACLRRGGGPY